MKAMLFFTGILLVFHTACSTKQTDPTVTALQGATILDGNGNRLEQGTILIEAGKIKAIGTSVTIPGDAEVMNLEGAFITPGLVDAHVHFGQTGFVDGRPDALDIRDSIDYIELQAYLRTHPELFYESYLRSGVTAVYDVGGYPWTVGLQKTAESNPLAPHVSAAGPLLTPVPQEDLETFNTPAEKQMLELSSIQAGKEAVRYNHGIGSTGIKIWQINLRDPNFMESLEAVARETQDLGNKLIVHSTTLDQAKAAIDLGAKVFVHSVEDIEADVEFLAKAKRNNAIYIPTLVVLGGYHKAYDAVLHGGFELNDPHGAVDERTRALLQGAEGFKSLIDTVQLQSRMEPLMNYIRYTDSVMALNLVRAYKSGIRIAVGTDAGNPGTVHGISIFDEMEAMQNAGIPASELVVMATRNGAAAMGRLQDIGTLEPGKWADLVILEKDPAADISHMRSLTHVMRAGTLHSVDEPLKK